MQTSANRQSRPKFLSTPSARRATSLHQSPGISFRISIHALREEGDRHAHGCRPAHCHFYPRPPRGGRRDDADVTYNFNAISIHALREEGDPQFANLGEQPVKFLSTPSARRATACPPIPSRCRSDFYPRPPRGGRQQKQRKNPCFYSIINHSAQNGKSCNCAEHERCVFCGKNIRFSGAKKTEKA